MNGRDETPTYIAQCTACHGLLAAAVADLESPHMVDAVKLRDEWRKAGLTVRTVTVQTVREWPDGLGHRATCSHAIPKPQRLAL